MSDYIKREDTIIEIERFCGYLDDDMLYRIKLALGRLPSADVVEVRHGHWKCEEVPCVFGKKFILTCSECGESVSVTEEALPEEHYCRSCGARMDGEEQEHEYID